MMSQKYKLTTDTEDDSVRASIKRHLRLASLLVVVPIVVVIILSVISITAGIRQRAVNENHRAAIAMTRTAMPTRTPRPPSTPVPPPSAKVDIPLRTAPGLRYEAIGEIAKGETIWIEGRDSTGNWYMVQGSFWIEAAAVANAPRNLPVVGP